MRNDKQEELRLSFIRFEVMPTLLFVAAVWIASMILDEMMGWLAGIALVYLIIRTLMIDRQIKKLA